MSGCCCRSAAAKPSSRSSAPTRRISIEGGFKINNLMGVRSRTTPVQRRQRRHRPRPRPRTGEPPRSDDVIELTRPLRDRPVARHFPGIDLRLEADQQFAAEIEHRPLDHRRLRQHQRERLALVEAFLVAVGQFAKRGAGAIEQRFPAEFIGPALELVLGDALASCSRGSRRRRRGRRARRGPSSWCRSS